MAVNCPPAPLDPPLLLDELLPASVPPSSPPPLLLELLVLLELPELLLPELLLLELVLLELPLLELVLLDSPPLELELLELPELLEPDPFPVPLPVLSEEHATIETPAAAKKNTPNRVAFMSGLLHGSMRGTRGLYDLPNTTQREPSARRATGDDLIRSAMKRGTIIVAGGGLRGQAIAHEPVGVQWIAQTSLVHASSISGQRRAIREVASVPSPCASGPLSTTTRPLPAWQRSSWSCSAGSWQ
jgi:hypothetical protein